MSCFAISNINDILVAQYLNAIIRIDLKSKKYINTNLFVRG